MSYGPISVFTQSVASAATLSAEFDLGGRAWQSAYLVIQSMTSNSQLHIQASDAAGGTYRRVQHPPVNSATVANNTWTVLSSVTSAFVPLPAGLRFVKVEQTATADSGQSYKVVCAN